MADSEEILPVVFDIGSGIVKVGIILTFICILVLLKLDKR